MDRKVLSVFAGANGSGKSTIVQKLIASGDCPGMFICPDNLIDPTDSDMNTAYKNAMNKAEQERETALINGISFSFETVLSRKDKVKFIERAKEKGYKIHVYYVLTSSPQVNIERVSKRVSQGGHDVPTDKLLARYERAMNLMPSVLSLADQVVIYDNSGEKPSVLLMFFRSSEVVIMLGGHKAEGVQSICIRTNPAPDWFTEKYKDAVDYALKSNR